MASIIGMERNFLQESKGHKSINSTYCIGDLYVLFNDQDTQYNWT